MSTIKNKVKKDTGKTYSPPAKHAGQAKKLLKM